MSGAPATLALGLRDIHVTLGERPVLRGVSLRAEPGEIVGVLGRNGAGKTTLLRVASGGCEPDRGEVRIGDRPLASFSRRERARTIAVVPQEFHAPFPFRAGEIVLMGRAPHQGFLGLDSPGDVRAAMGALERAGVGDLADRSVFELSSGERQLVLFARALAQDTPWLLLDEPTAFLDLRHRVDLLEVVRERAAEGRGALIVSHDLALAARVCDRLVLLADGAPVAVGSAAEVLAPGPLRQAFQIETDVLRAPDGKPVVVPRVGKTSNRTEAGP